MSELERKNSSPEGNCRFAIPKKGRLFDKVVQMLKGAGIEFRREPRLDVALCVGLPITLVFLPAADIAKFVGEGNVDLGITGLDVVKESGVDVTRIMDLGFGKCKLCVQAPVADKVQGPEELAGKRIVTSFPELTTKFFDQYDEKKGVKTKVRFVSGSVEAACGLGFADAVVALVETGTTMKVSCVLRVVKACRSCKFRLTIYFHSPMLRCIVAKAAGLEVVTDILSTQAILIGNPHVEHQDLVNLIKRRIEGYITATKYVMIVYNISSELLHECAKITPGKRSPTVTTLDDGKSKSVSSLVLKSELAEKMDKLHDIGATDILVLEIANSRM